MEIVSASFYTNFHQTPSFFDVGISIKVLLKNYYCNKFSSREHFHNKVTYKLIQNKNAIHYVISIEKK